MAGSKETPRQKMIGMMYLVLTALLALQVSSALIYKFQYLNDSLEKTVAETKDISSEKLKNIASAVKQKGNKADEVKLKEEAEAISQKTRDLVTFIDNLKKDMITKTGGLEEDGTLKGAKEETEVEVIMIGAAKNGKAYELKKKLNDYVSFVNERSDKKFGAIALDASEDPLLKNNPDQRNKDFAELNFGQTPLVAALAALSEMESRVVGIEAVVLDAKSKKLDADEYKVDELLPMVRTGTKIIPAGMKYEADVFLTAITNSDKPKISVGNADLVVDNNGVGKFSFTASGGNYIGGEIKKSWTGKIKIKKPNGQDTIYTITEDYIVTEPVIQVQSATPPALYKNCGNNLNIQVPALANNYNPDFKIEGASVTKGSRKGEVMIVPTGSIPTVSLKVSSNGNYIGEQKFTIKLIPPPTVEVRVNGRVIDPRVGVEAKTVRNISVRMIPNPDFQRMLPREANYNITEWAVSLGRGRRGSPAKTFKTATINVNDLGSQLNPNDNIIIDIKQVKRRNYKGDLEDVKMPEKPEVVSLF
ncbi:MAG: gliding motility protein GldM [Sporocytophaga sp.]|uniref:type IX secretion system motor protein PorM/GldM n=1 Tax=Sporocytophaga sp. TaxID=2231183 RepID=UPI001B212548|nr:gliding motility protein GldM [Sporocytophaga sp.]MBO9698916.1 gliding motility protein GldM [Sporocytophaga sp.]